MNENENKCCAGFLCKIEDVPLSNSDKEHIRQCVNCQKSFHRNSCGILWRERDSKNIDYPVEHLSGEGKMFAAFDDATLCNLCIYFHDKKDSMEVEDEW